LGAGFFLATPAAQLALGIVSTALLLLLAALFLRGAAKAFRSRIAAPASEKAGRGYPLGLGMSLTSPWNIAFWLAVLGRPETAQRGAGGAIVVAAAVIAGTLSWCVILCSAVALLRLRFDGAWWQAVAMGATGVLMLAFAILNLVRLAGF
jgi:threonine/homoserine/homoserine lactone efflux protein